jgi:hypothetical protein
MERGEEEMGRKLYYKCILNKWTECGGCEEGWGSGRSLGKATVQFLISPRRSVVRTFANSGVSRCPSGMEH